MLALYMTIPLAMILAGIALFAFVKAYKSGQFDDIEAPKYRIFFEEEFPSKKE
ncbi:MAG: cbb3-type cytochrome oxidase assembly protein CcoS [Leptospiraceae bacterium]|nr:cbb3-type cytochrome oxidase assembly protein CcoS [Leptospiraceae bacterium]